jgi:hypothetical protein
MIIILIMPGTARSFDDTRKYSLNIMDKSLPATSFEII